ncbi:MAG: DeoR/GlpR family DNA-binding transcription regulator [Paracoccaceae bacterium]|jgi:DeoR family fructose operon transcriptional repressor
MKIDRATAIRQLLFARGHLTIPEIAEAVGASEPTVRRDLAALEMGGAITRSHGGARIADASAAEIEFESREQINLAAKRAIGEAAFARLHPHSAVFLDAGTTVLQLARLIRLRPLPLKVFTNCLPVAQHLMPVDGLSVTLLGGTLRRENASMVGPLAEAALADLWFDQLFLGVGAVGPDAAIYSADAHEARINRLMLERTAAPVILTDSDKFGARLTHRVVGLAAGMQVITDARLSAEWKARLREIGVDLALAGGA